MSNLIQRFNIVVRLSEKLNDVIKSVHAKLFAVRRISLNENVQCKINGDYCFPLSMYLSEQFTGQHEDIGLKFAFHASHMNAGAS